MDYMHQSAGYLGGAFAESLDNMAKALKFDVGGRAEFDTIVGTGLSGALVVPTLGRMLGVHWGIVRKPGDSAHSSKTYEGDLGRRWIMVDDLIDSGRTVQRVYEAVDRVATRHNWETEFMGWWGYDNMWGGWTNPQWFVDRGLIPPVARPLKVVPEAGQPPAGHPGAESSAPTPVLPVPDSPSLVW